MIFNSYVKLPEGTAEKQLGIGRISHGKNHRFEWMEIDMGISWGMYPKHTWLKWFGTMTFYDFPETVGNIFL